MDGMGAAPEIVGRQRQYTERTADPVIERLLAEEGAVTAIVLDQEQPHEETGSWHGQQ